MNGTFVAKGIKVQGNRISLGSTINIVVNLNTGFIPLNLQLIVRMITMKVSVIFVVSDSKLIWQSIEIEIACNSQQKQSAMYLPYLFRLLFFC